MAPQLDWSTAAVRQATLTVELDDEPPSGWKQGFATTVRLLGSGQWGEVTVKKQTVRVKDVPAGQEEKLRHFLDSVVEQANASHSSKSDNDDAEPKAEVDESDGPDAEMAQRFRAFAESDDEAPADPG